MAIRQQTIQVQVGELFWGFFLCVWVRTGEQKGLLRPLLAAAAPEKMFKETFFQRRIFDFENHPSEFMWFKFPSTTFAQGNFRNFV